MTPPADPDALLQPAPEVAAFVAEQTGRAYLSEWLAVEQATIDAFADATGDHMFLHVDPEAAARTEFGGTIAHGFLTLSLLAPLRTSTQRPKIPGLRNGLNYGFDRVRMIAPVRSGSRLRAQFTIVSLEQRSPDRWLETMDVVVEIAGEPKPALLARWLTMYLLGS